VAEVTISREAVELAARTLVDSGAVSGKGWDGLQPAAKFAWAQRVRKALQAAGPLVVADAYEHAGQFLDNEPDEDTCRQFPDLSHDDGCGATGLSCAAKFLRTQAAELRAQS
jgi:hypothetical protein